MTQLIVIVLSLLSISFICSLLESIVLSVSNPFIETLIERKKRSGFLWRRFKSRINEPIASILTLNTISNTAGAAMAGSLALRVWGSNWVAVFSAALTFAILIFAEIIPKTIGATYWKQLAVPAAWMLKFLIIVLKPVVIPVNALSRLIAARRPYENITREDVISSIRLGHLEGVIESSEFNLVSNIFKLKQIPIRDIMTPRTVVFSLSADQTVGEAFQQSDILQYSRIPLYDKATNQVSGVVLRRDIILKVAEDKKDIPLKSLARTPHYVAETLSCFTLLDRLISKKVHISFIINEYGDYVGIATMEDAIETLLGREIIDESDRVVDMRKLARQRLKNRSQRFTWTKSEQKNNDNR